MRRQVDLKINISLGVINILLKKPILGKAYFLSSMAIIIASVIGLGCVIKSTLQGQNPTPLRVWLLHSKAAYAAFNNFSPSLLGLCLCSPML
ncbi:hypothetical protein MiSe_87260 [Microseira wollei NIES-4236]|uniref:Uncharacterized protein n=1 Tax=Microseira wollei NIES-4236 TaxID=2530354 RepID=A0AAV3XTC4_9CYAN|nr:hypothetical protein MiSe_87260 [Microseira wollei NIES-4236]